MRSSESIPGGVGGDIDDAGPGDVEEYNSGVNGVSALVGGSGVLLQQTALRKGSSEGIWIST